ncbi:MAG: bifunctional methylenetetrahydrofolate dehydrogenase/methenyltetrahydrofolate cyclohydrolase FolD [Gemmatimonadota bacterium]|jgi:methylenetetrahydrofolate dehydrogenase (NADP+)/methenyltetrahydrofolate cyclohydrolase|nr:bifunctional methylenetetrahydrofolate dehydrogenase/methenyltetrahydrofolate cyclohydrolase FolD [Gemmatimonadota bacterium]HAD74335.1 bifunctional methylenetetrahydrofolate dehydrogenase/methenyltetrahydrofolate cyclohydrolase FolD [Gemmatimonadota bacterium]
MSTELISGKEMAVSIREEIKERVTGLKEDGLTPGLAVVLLGEDPASQVYVRSKNKAATEAGIYSRQITMSEDTSEDELLGVVSGLNADPEIHGILVQLPLPDQIDETNVLSAIDPAKDVDGFHPVNVGRLASGDPNALAPCTPAGVVEMLLRSGNDPAGKHVVVVGRSSIVGRPMAALLLRKGPGGNATVTVAHSGTPDLGAVTREADILIVAIGQPDLIRGDMVKPGAVVIDVGVNRVDDDTRDRGYRLTGDVAFDEVKEVASAISPVPGGVGPMTIAMLLSNTLDAAVGSQAVTARESVSHREG